jgi:hypothetical protein
MKFSIFLVLFVWFSKSIFAQVRLEVGDLIFVSYRPCFICKIIEEEVDSPYSHLGIVIEVDKTSNIWIAEARRSVRKIKLSEFIFQTSRADIFRLSKASLIDKYNFKQLLTASYYNYFQGLPYDSAFDWENVDIKGNELLYCSEFITKLLNPLINTKIKTRPMSYLIHFPIWVNYFSPHPVPQGELGNNPQSLFDDLDLVFIGSLGENNKILEE